jgi:hypothetical protein
LWSLRPQTNGEDEAISIWEEAISLIIGHHDIE